MAGTFPQLLLHIVFSTKLRTPWITDEVAQRLDPYLRGIIRSERGTLYAIGGIEDHTHPCRKLMFAHVDPDDISPLARTRRGPPQRTPPR